MAEFFLKRSGGKGGGTDGCKKQNRCETECSGEGLHPVRRPFFFPGPFLEAAGAGLLFLIPRAGGGKSRKPDLLKV
jgi:hypothetical protein